MSDPELAPIEKDIIKVLYAANKPLTTNQVSKKVGCTWDTAHQYLLSLYRKDITRYGYFTYGKRLHWFLKTDKRDEDFRFGKFPPVYDELFI